MWKLERPSVLSKGRRGRTLDLDRYRRGPELPGYFGDPETHGETRAEPKQKFGWGKRNPAIRFETPAPLWSYALEYKAKPQETRPILVDVVLQVERGCVAVGANIEDELLRSNEVQCPASGSKQTASFWVPAWQRLESIILRNASPDGGSIATVHAVVAYEGQDDYETQSRKFTPENIGWDDVLVDATRSRWGTVPGGTKRLQSEDLLSLSDAELLDRWQSELVRATTDTRFFDRGWRHLLYKDALSGKRIVDVGSGLGFDGITLAKGGATVVFADLVETNLTLLERLCGLLGLDNVEFLHVESPQSYASLSDLDAVWASGSLHHLPYPLAKQECDHLLKALRPDGRWLELCYPPERWVKDGRPDFRQWGIWTDGLGTPWAEWYDLEKLLARLAPAKFVPVLNTNFHSDRFVWFDLLRSG